MYYVGTALLDSDHETNPIANNWIDAYLLPFLVPCKPNAMSLPSQWSQPPLQPLPGIAIP